MAYGLYPTASMLRRSAGMRLALVIIASWLLGASVGCQKESGPPPPTDPNMLRGIVRIYGIAANELKRPPQNMEELKTVLAPVTNEPDKFLRSTRDGQEFAVVWGMQIDQTAPDTVIAHEQKGVDGKRMVVTADGTVSEATAEEFSKLKFPKNYKPAG
jgi:hypothetical protein